MKTNLAILAASALSLGVSVANATVFSANYTSGSHNEAWYIAGSNGAALAPVYGDGALAGVSPQNKCVDGVAFAGTPPNFTDAAPATPCSSRSGVVIAPAPPNPGYVGPAVVVAGNNGTYQTNVGGATPTATFAGALTFDDALTFTHTDQITSVTETWMVVTGGSLAWLGAYGFEVTVPASATSGNVGGSFFDYSFANGNVNLLTGVRTSTSKCDLGIAGAAIVGTLLCGVANPASAFQYANSGAYVKPTNWVGVRDNGNGTIDLLMWGNRRTATGAGNDLQERLTLTANIVPVPATVWLFGSALGLMGAMRRKIAS